MTRMVAHILIAGAVAAALAGCTGAEVATEPVTARESPSVAPSPVAGAGVAPFELDVRFVDGRVDPFPQRVDIALGTPVVLRVETDTPTEIHVHGYDRSGDAAPASPARIEFVADLPGVFAVEAHPETLLLQLAVQ